MVNNHVARFVAWGRHAATLLSTQPWNDAFGHGSALERFVDLDGRILLIGCYYDTVTFLHYAEHVVDIADKRVARFKVPVLKTACASGGRCGNRHRRRRACQLARSFLRAVDGRIWHGR